MNQRNPPKILRRLPSTGRNFDATFGGRSGILYSMFRESLRTFLLVVLLTIGGAAQSPARLPDPGRHQDRTKTPDPAIPVSQADPLNQTGPEAPAPVSAPATAQPADSTSKPSNWLWSLTIRNRTGWRTSTPRQTQMSRTYLDAKGIYRIDDTWSLTLEGRAHFDPVGRLGYPTRLWLDPRQAILDGRIARVDLKLGLQQVVWGQADGLRVLDVINPLDYREFILEDFLDSRRPLWMARADLPIGAGSLQLLWVPYFAPGRIPTGNDEFSLTAPGANGPGAGFGSPPAFLPTRRPAYRLRNSQAGFRYSRNIGGWDLTANYFKGWEDLPTPYQAGLRPVNPGLFQLEIEPRHERKEVLGGTAANSFGSFVLRMEAGLSRRRPVPVSPALTGGPAAPGGYVKRDQFSGVVGLDYAARPWLWLSGQYFWQATPAGGVPLALPRHNHLLSFYVRTNFQRDTLRPEIFILTGLNERQSMIRPRLVKSIGDHWSVGLGVDLLGGAPGNLFGNFAQRDRAVIELKWMR